MVAAFIAGATGFTGREVVRLWTEAGHQAIAHVRPDSKRRAEWTERFEGMGAIVDCTPWNEAAMTETVNRLEPRVIFALLGTTKKRAAQENAAGKDSSYETIDYGLTAMLVRCAVATKSFPRFVYLSSLGVTDKRPGGAYMLARWKVEQELKATALPWLIARPSFITGPGRDDARPGERYGAGAVNAVLGLAGALGLKRLRNRYASQTNSQLATSLVQLALEPNAARNVYLSEELGGR